MFELKDLDRQAAMILVTAVMNDAENAFITYSDLAGRLNPPADPHKDLRWIIGSVSVKCHELGLPLLSANVIYKDEFKPGPGFYNLYCELNPGAKQNNRKNELDVWVNEIRKIKEHDDWSPLLDYLNESCEAEIRVIPMSPDEFDGASIKQVQMSYFQQILPFDNNNEYEYAVRGINCGHGALLLFQYQNSVIASAIYDSIDKDEHRIRLIHGSIAVFEPITEDEMIEIDNSFKSFGNVKLHLNPDCKSRLLEMIDNRKYYLDPRDFDEYIQVTSTECDQIVKGRIGQSGFRNDLLRLYSKCLICGIDLQPILRASHIKPWKDSDDRERLDKYNGLLFCPTHDALFDEGYISFDDNGDIIISSQIDKSLYSIMSIDEDVRIDVYPQSNKYLQWHRDHMKT